MLTAITRAGLCARLGATQSVGSDLRCQLIYVSQQLINLGARGLRHAAEEVLERCRGHVAEGCVVNTTGTQAAQPPRRVVVTRIVTLAISVLTTALAALYYIAPATVLPYLKKANRYSARLTEETTQVQTHRVHYLAGGSGSPVLLLHGLFAEKDHWVDFVRAFGGGHHFIIPDLPGFGQSGRNYGESYRYEDQVDRLVTFLDLIGVERVHVAGNSMGGTLAALLAVRYPERVVSVAFIGAPHGIQTPVRSDLDMQIDGGATSPLVPRTVAQYEAMLEFIFHSRPFLPYPQLHVAQKAALRDAESNASLWNGQLKERYLLDLHVRELQRPLLVLWGRHDRLFDVSGADVIRHHLPQSKIIVMDDVGHLPMLEASGASAHAYRHFLATYAR